MGLLPRLVTAALALAANISLARADNQLANVFESEAEVSIEISESADGNWGVTYRFAEPQSALVLSQSPATYRKWEPLSEGVAMWRIGGMEGFVFREPATVASFRFEPFSGNLPAAYTPFLAFSDGSYGVLSGQFRVKPIAALSEAVEFEKTGEEWPEPVMSSRVTIASTRPVSPQSDGVYSEYLPAGDGSYVYVGSLTPVEGESFRGYIDPGLPGWLTEDFDSDRYCAG